MKKGESNLTSLISAFGRAYHILFDTPKIFNDYIAKDLISQKEFNDIKENEDLTEKAQTFVNQRGYGLYFSKKTFENLKKS